MTRFTPAAVLKRTAFFINSVRPGPGSLALHIMSKHKSAALIRVAAVSVGRWKYHVPGHIQWDAVSRRTWLYQRHYVWYNAKVVKYSEICTEEKLQVTEGSTGLSQGFLWMRVVFFESTQNYFVISCTSRHAATLTGPRNKKSGHWRWPNTLECSRNHRPFASNTHAVSWWLPISFLAPSLLAVDKLMLAVCRQDHDDGACVDVPAHRRHGALVAAQGGSAVARHPRAGLGALVNIQKSNDRNNKNKQQKSMWVPNIVYLATNIICYDSS